MNKKLQNNQRKWIQIGRLENKIKHFKERYKRIQLHCFPTMPAEDVEITRRSAAEKLKGAKELRKKLIRQALMSLGE